MFNYDYTVSVSDVFCSSVQIETATGPCQQPHGYTYQVCVHLKAPYVNTTRGKWIILSFKRLSRLYAINWITRI